MATSSLPRIAIVLDSLLPVRGYGGTERAAWWLLKGLAERGAPAVLLAKRGSHCPFARAVLPLDAAVPPEAQLAEHKVDLVHYFSGTPALSPVLPYLVTIHGNGQEGETFLPNTSFVSHDHARRHGATAFVWNGVDPDEYRFQERKNQRLLFLAKASWSVKNVRGATRIARRAKMPLDVVGGSMPWWAWPTGRGAQWHSTLGGERKALLLAESRALLFPVRWDEPFGIAVVESLVSGTPVLASPFGSLPELIAPDVGYLCASEAAFVDAIGALSAIRASRCREYAVEKFHYRAMTRGYLSLYERILAGSSLHEGALRALGPFGKRELPRRGA